MSTAPVPLPDSTPGLSRLATINAALRQLDPDALVALDPDGGKMKVLTVLPPAEVVQILKALGETAELSGEVSDGDTGDDAVVATGGGSCGCGCSRR